MKNSDIKQNLNSLSNTILQEVAIDLNFNPHFDEEGKRIEFDQNAHNLSQPLVIKTLRENLKDSFTFNPYNEDHKKFAKDFSKIFINSWGKIYGKNSGGDIDQLNEKYVKNLKAEYAKSTIFNKFPQYLKTSELNLTLEKSTNSDGLLSILRRPDTQTRTAVGTKVNQSEKQNS